MAWGWLVVVAELLSTKLFLRFVVMGLLVLWAGRPFLSCAVHGITFGPQAMQDCEREHISMAEFVVRYYNDSTVVLNDIGTSAFYSRAKLLDLGGLGSREPVWLLRQNLFTAPEVERWAASQSAEIAILQEDWGWVAGRVPQSWSRVGEWKLPRNLAYPGSLRVGFYALRKGERDKLLVSLREFGARLPAGVHQSLVE